MEDRNPQFRIYRIPDAVRAALVRLRTSDVRPLLFRRTSPGMMPHQLHTPHLLREYQKDAIRRWEASHRRGILEMATETGKTPTALINSLQTGPPQKRRQNVRNTSDFP